jgi:hypothetical protein
MTSPDQAWISIRRLSDWITRNQNEGYDPFDGLSSPYIGWMRGNGALCNLLRTVWQQTVLRSPINLRPALGIRKQVNYKAMAFLVVANLGLYRLTLDKSHLAVAREGLEWLIEHSNRDYSGLCWSNTHNYQSRLAFLPSGVPTVVGSAHAARAFLDAYDTLGEQEYLGVARSTCDFILRDLPRHREEDAICISYIPTGDVPVHNANMLAAAVLARVHKHSGERELLETSRMAVTYTINHQRGDGSWYYGEGWNLHWIDSFHTAYILDSLRTYLESGGDDLSGATSLKRGMDYFVGHFIGADGSPYLYADRAYPVDIQGAAQSIETLAVHCGTDRRLLPLAWKAAAWTIQHMQDPKGYFYFRQYRWGTNKTAHIHWGQATMLVALVRLHQALNAGLQVGSEDGSSWAS